MQPSPVVLPNSQFTSDSVNIMTQHELLVMLMGDSCHTRYAPCMTGQTQVE